MALEAEAIGGRAWRWEGEMKILVMSVEVCECDRQAMAHAR